jgi:hypothetical protein
MTEAASTLTPAEPDHETTELDSPEVAMQPAVDSPDEPSAVPAAEASVLASETAPVAVDPLALPVPIGRPRRQSLWRRLMRRSDAASSEPSGFQELVKSRLDGITLRLESFEHGLTRGETRQEEQSAQLTRIEQQLESLVHLRECAEQARDAAQKAAGAARQATGAVWVAAALVAVSVVIAAAMMTVALN